MWQTKTDVIEPDRKHRFVILNQEDPLSFENVLSLWQDCWEFRAFFVALVADSPFDAFRWETPGVTAGTLDRDFEFVFLRYSSLMRTADPTAFAEYFSGDVDVVTFPSLGKDAMLIVPCPMNEPSDYGHLASFFRNAPDSQKHHLLQAMSAAMRARIGSKPVWLNSAGMGVPWLHVRLDNQPKYYRYEPYRRPLADV